MAGTDSLEGANSFFRESYVARFNEKFTVTAAEKGTAFRRTARADLEWVFTVQSERVVAKDNTVDIGERHWYPISIDFIDNRAIDIVHIEPLTAGGIRETKHIADYAAMRRIPTAVHCYVSPLGMIADVHAIATVRDFLALERNDVYPDLPWWQDLVTGVPQAAHPEWLHCGA